MRKFSKTRTFTGLIMILVFFVTQFILGSMGRGQTFPSWGQVSVAFGIFVGLGLRDLMVGDQAK